MVVISDLNGTSFLRPSSYSQAGFRARCAAHRQQVRLAAEAGLILPQEVRDQYVFGGKDPALARPWRIEDQNAATDA